MIWCSHCKELYLDDVDGFCPYCDRLLFNEGVVKMATRDRTVFCEVIKPVGYHDNHEVGETIRVEQRYLDEMVREGYVRVKNRCACSESKPNSDKRS